MGSNRNAELKWALIRSSSLLGNPHQSEILSSVLLDRSQLYYLATFMRKAPVLYLTSIKSVHRETLVKY
jgi:hypothetical protein